MPPTSGQIASPKSARRHAAIVEPVLKRWFTERYLARADETLAGIRAAFQAVDPIGYVGCCAAIRDMDLRGNLARSGLPTLVSGHHDFATRRNWGGNRCHHRRSDARRAAVGPYSDTEAPGLLRTRCCSFSPTASGDRARALRVRSPPPQRCWARAMSRRLQRSRRSMPNTRTSSPVTHGARCGPAMFSTTVSGGFWCWR